MTRLEPVTVNLLTGRVTYAATFADEPEEPGAGCYTPLPVPPPALDLDEPHWSEASH